jgi:pimeloyl-[acyl-carrier protein] synthase
VLGRCTTGAHAQGSSRSKRRNTIVGVRNELTYNPFLPEMIEDPYPVYRRLRDEDPVHYSDVVRAWVLTRHADVALALTDPRFSSDRTTAKKYRGAPRRGSGTFQIDPPQHTRVRGLVAKVFTPKVIEAMRTRVEVVIDDLIARTTDRNELDVIDQVAYPLPVTVISEIIGVPTKDGDKFQRWGRELAPALDHVFSGRERTTVQTEMAVYFVDLVAQRRAEPRDDLVSGLLHARDGDDGLTNTEIVEVLVFLLFAGHETTVNLIGNGMLSLLRHRDEFERVRDGGVDRSCVEELLRYESPAQIVARTVATDIEMDGRALRPGDSVVTLLGAANRDPEAFDDPESVDVGRSPNPHVAFGNGSHFCLGAQLSRLEARVAIPALVRRFPRMRLAQDAPDWRSTAVLRGLNSLVVKLGY